MPANLRAFEYTRTSDTKGVDLPYEEKFAEFLKAIADAKGQKVDVIIIAQPWVIGDTYEELMESLSRLAGTGLGLCIAKR